MPNDILMALAEQPGADKSTVFNLLTSARRRAANEPGAKPLGWLAARGFPALPESSASIRNLRQTKEVCHDL